MNKIFILVVINLLLIVSPLFSAQKKSLKTLLKQTESYLYQKKNVVRVEKADSTVPLYVAYAYYTINASFNKVAPLLSNLEDYEKLFRHITDMRQVKDKWNPQDTLYYIEGKTSYLHGWGLGKLTEFNVTDSLIMLKVRPANNFIINRYKRERIGKIKYYVRKVYLDGELIPIDSTTCRIGIRGVSSTNKAVPTWILSLVIKIVFPGLIKDIENGAKKQLKSQNYFITSTK